MPVDDQRQPGYQNASASVRSGSARLVRAWGALEPDQRLAVVAAVAMFLTMLLPWYQQNAVVNSAKAQPLVSRDLNAFAVFSFVEAAVLLVAGAILVLMFARAERRSFHLPGGDGTVVFAAGIWTALLLVLRLFDKPGITSHGVAANVGIQWGIFFALAATGLLIYAGSRMRKASIPEPPLVASHGQRRRRDQARSPTTVAPVWAQDTEYTEYGEHSASATTRERARYPPSPPLSENQAGSEDSTRRLRATHSSSPPNPSKARGSSAGEQSTEQLSFDEEPSRVPSSDEDSPPEKH